MATRWGIASTGLICHDFANLVTSLCSPEEHKIVAVAASSQSKADSFAKTFNIPKVTELRPYLLVQVSDKLMKFYFRTYETRLT
jgi:hypothetical protein